MKYIVIYCHPNPHSFNRAVLERVVSILREKSHEVSIRNLYELQFRPHLDADDLAKISRHELPGDILKEQQTLKDADTMVFIFPIWWYGMPAMLKGYIDRVFSGGFAFEKTQQGMRGMLIKRAILITTTGNAESVYEKHGYHDAIRKSVVNGILEFCGMQFVTHKYLYRVPFITQEERQKMLEELAYLPWE